MQLLKVGLLVLLFMRVAVNLRRTGWGKFKLFAWKDRAFGFQYQHTKRKVRGICLRLVIQDKWRFVLRRESRFDRLAKTLGVASEWQTGDKKFDQRVFILSEDASLNRALSRDAELRDAVDRLLDHDRARLECKGGMLYCEFPCQPPSEGEGSAKISSRFPGELSAMVKVGDALQRIHAGRWQEERDLTLSRKAWLVGISMVLAVVGLVALFLDMGHDSRQVVREAIPRLATVVTVGLICSLLLATFAWLRSTPHTHSVLLDVLLAAAPGCWMATSVAATAYNEEFDRSAARQVPVRVWYAEVKRARKGRSHYLYVEQWPDPRGKQRVRIKEHEYQWIQHASCITVTWHDGRLGDGWVSGYLPGCENGTAVER